MTEILTKIIVDCSTGIETIEPLTVEELAQREIDIAAYAEQQAVQAAAEQARAELKTSALGKLVAGLPLTEDEAALLVI